MDVGGEDEDEAGEEDVVVLLNVVAGEQMQVVMSVSTSGILGLVRRRTVPTHMNNKVNARGSLSQRNSNKLAVITTTSRGTLVTLTCPRNQTS